MSLEIPKNLKLRLKKFLFFVVFFLVALFLAIPFYDDIFLANIPRFFPAPLAGKCIIIDPGHGGPDGGAKGIYGAVEKDITLKISLLLRDFLQEAGAYVVMTREVDKDLADKGILSFNRRKTQDLMRRVSLVHKKRADIFVSIHLNFFRDKNLRGSQAFYNPVLEKNKKLAFCIQKELIRDLKTTFFALQKNDIYILRESKVPTVLVEAGFITNPEEEKLLLTRSYQKKIASAIYHGILSYFDK